eukprot:scaffold24883_cov33-Phaeocystis_antarctica.AAC.1
MGYRSSRRGFNSSAAGSRPRERQCRHMASWPPLPCRRRSRAPAELGTGEMGVAGEVAGRVPRLSASRGFRRGLCLEGGA